MLSALVPFSAAAIGDVFKKRMLSKWTLFEYCSSVKVAVPFCWAPIVERGKAQVADLGMVEGVVIGFVPPIVASWAAEPVVVVVAVAVEVLGSAKSVAVVFRRNRPPENEPMGSPERKVFCFGCS
jgi:hypothetical protein